jgi:chromosome segregation ATPase
MKISLMAVFVALLLGSCISKASYDEMKLQNDSLQNAKHMIERELDDYFQAMNEISDNFDKIKGAENVISVNAQNELQGDRRAKVINDFEYINDLINTNREKIADLENKLKKSSITSGQLRETVARLTDELKVAQERVSTLEDELKKKDSRIFALNTSVDSLNLHIDVLDENISSLEQEKRENQRIIDEQTYELNSAYYCIGTSRELKNEKILTAGGLFSKAKVMKSNFNKSFFTRIDITETKRIPLNAGKIKIMTDHPVNSFILETANPLDNTDKNLILKINNAQEFWSTSKFLVVEVR